MLPSNVRGSRRISSAQAFLAPARRRPKVAIRAEHLVHRVCAEGSRVTAVELSHHGRVERIAADRITVCARAINTPALLLRSGIDAAQCAALGLRSIADLPGVGARLQDHPSVILWLPPQPGGVPARPVLHQAMARLPSVDGDEPPDLHLYGIEGHDTTAQTLLATMLGCTRTHGLAVTLARPLSRGRVTLGSADPKDAPLIELACAAPRPTPIA